MTVSPPPNQEDTMNHNETARDTTERELPDEAEYAERTGGARAEHKEEAMEKDLSGRPSDATTTHAEWGSGEPHLLVSGGDVRETFPLTAEAVRIGSSPDCDLVLAGADPVHATITHDDRDEYVLALHGEGETSARDGGDDQVLRTGARFTIADWTLVFGRAEYADHGRPYGGREGGELSDQPGQPQRPDYAHGESPQGDSSSQGDSSTQGDSSSQGDDERGFEVRRG